MDCRRDNVTEYESIYIYGLPDAGRAFYFLYKEKLIAEGFIMSNLDPCLFFRVSEVETTYVAIFVDDTFIFTNNIDNARRFVERKKKYF